MGRVALGAALCWAASALWVARPAGADELRLMVGHWCPFVCTQAGELRGFAADIALAVLQQPGVQVSLVEASYTRSIEMVRGGEADGMIGTTREDAPDLIFPDEEQGLTSYTFFVKAGNPWRYTDIVSIFRLHKIGTVQSYNYLELSDAITRNPEMFDEIAGSDVVQRSVRKLLAGRFDAFIYDAVVTEFELRRMGKAADVVPAGRLRELMRVYVGFSPKRPEARQLAEQLTRGTRALRASGALAQILARYGTQDWRP